MPPLRDKLAAVISDAAAGIIALLNIPLALYALLLTWLGSVADTSLAEARAALIGGGPVSMCCVASAILLWTARRRPPQPKRAITVIVINALSFIPIISATVLSDSWSWLAALVFPMANILCAICLLRFPLPSLPPQTLICVHCDYDRAGIETHARCPECGQSQ